ncbi:hypothetical protein CBM2589_B120099 [Cupriavidus taiwanensis]|uniref:Uncharacterized protein n=1 Tax=Cupriavidus taiwanensis TaxID=164546 RepID=A0A975ZXZ3_9BURK|nr:hypothetical protein CBM2589_B120099 [Cupriavidus taiwanensis]
MVRGDCRFHTAGSAGRGRRRERRHWRDAVAPHILPEGGARGGHAAAPAGARATAHQARRGIAFVPHLPLC